ncbi:hypothetical protein [Nonomuraea sp. 10N515B]
MADKHPRPLAARQEPRTVIIGFDILHDHGALQRVGFRRSR